MATKYRRRQCLDFSVAMPQRARSRLTYRASDMKVGAIVSRQQSRSMNLVPRHGDGCRRSAILGCVLLLNCLISSTLRQSVGPLSMDSQCHVGTYSSAQLFDSEIPHLQTPQASQFSQKQRSLSVRRQFQVCKRAGTTNHR